MKRSVPVLFLLFAAATAFGSNGRVSPFAPEEAYNAYGGAIERLEQRLPVFYGGSGQSAAYQVTYGTLSAATVFIGTEFGQAGRVAQVSRTASRPQLLLPAGRQPVALLPEYAESLAAKNATPSGHFYSVAFETRLNPSSYPGVSRARHFQEANENLLRAMEADASFAQMMQQGGVNLQRTATGLAPRTPPPGWTWHHAQESGVMQLVPHPQHTRGSIFWDTMHPGGQGGYSIWGQ